MLVGAGVPIHAEVRPVRTLSSFQARLADLARNGAMRRLRTRECQRLLTDYTDGEGRALADKLEPFAVPPDEYLALIPFLDGRGYPLCDAGRVHLISNVGTARFFVCEPFFKSVREDRAGAEMYVIHEMLHTLGLGENPPSSLAITWQVTRRCTS